MTETAQAEMAELRVAKIKGGKGVRKSYDPKALESLCKSIAQVGTLQPIVVSPSSKDTFDVVVGSRRLRAAYMAQRRTIPAIVMKDLTEVDKLLMALSENLHRENLTPFEEAAVIMELVRDHKMSMKDLARKIGRDESFIRRRIQLLSLPLIVQRQVARKELSVTHAEVLSDLKKPKEQLEFAILAQREKLTPPELVTAIREAGKKKEGKLRKTTWNRRSTRIVLEVIGFSKWLQGVMPEVIELPMNEMANVKVSLHALVDHALKGIKEIEQAYKKHKS